MNIENHPLHPFLPNPTKLLMLGSFPPQRKRWSVDFFYPNFTNDMWRIIGYIFENNKDFFIDYQNKCFKLDLLIPFLTEKQIGLYDTATTIRRLKDNASDKYLEIITPTDILSIINQQPQLQAIVTTGEKATITLAENLETTPPKIGEYTLYSFKNRNIKLYRMPSSSRAYPMKLENKCIFYKKMFLELGLL